MVAFLPAHLSSCPFGRCYVHTDDGVAEICCQVCLAGVPLGHCFPELWLPWGGKDTVEALGDLCTMVAS